MAESKGPKIDLPEGLAEELESKAPAASSPDAPSEDAAALQQEHEALKDRFLRLAADFENYKRRTLKEREELFNYGNEALIKELLETVDNLERALDHARGAEEGVEAGTLLEGVDLTYRGLMRVLERAGVMPVEASGKPFDPQLHEAVRQVETDDHPTGTVVEVHQTGYLLKDRLLRPALVGVSRPREGGSE